MSAAEAVIEAVKTALEEGDDKPDDLAVKRSRQQPKQTDDLPMVCLYLIREPVDPQRPNRPTAVQRRLTIRARIWHHSPAGETDALIEPIREYVVKTTMAALGPYGEEVTTEWDGDDTPQTHIAVADVDFTVGYATKRGELGAL